MTRAGTLSALLFLLWLAVYAYLAEQKHETALNFWTGGLIRAVAAAAQ